MTQLEQADFSAWQETGHANHGLHSHLTGEAAARKDLAVYYGMTSLMDREIGRILSRLDALAIADDTLVIFTSDHGHFLGQHGLWHKGPFHYEDVIRVPFIVRWRGGGVATGRVDSALQSLTDIPATMLAAASLEIPGRMQGINQLDVWQDKRPAARASVVVENRHQPTKLHLRTYVTNRYKLTVYRGASYGELFDLEADPDEANNRWADPAFAGIKADLMHRALQTEIAREPTCVPRIAHA
jgi:uncharacterized sulfatase